MLSKEVHIVPELNERTRLSDYAVNIFRLIPTRKGVKKAIKKGHVKLNDKLAHTGDWLKGGETIELELEESLVKPYKLVYPIMYEDDYLAVIHKPAGIPIHSHGHRNIQNTLGFNLRTSPVKDALHIARPVHRLDHETEGLLVIAKSYEAMIKLGAAFASSAIKKEYVAVTIGEMKNEGRIDKEIDGKSCSTQYKVDKTIVSKKYERLNLVNVMIKQGRRNQIRKHFLSIGNPILGDKKYYLANKISYGNGLYLLARSLTFEHPTSREQVICSIPLSKKFNRLFQIG